MAVPVPIPVIDDLPPAPRRNDGPPDFVLKADAMIASLHPLVAQINIALQWISGQLTATQASEKAAAVSAKAAADSATEATRQVGMAAKQVTLATVQAEAAAVSALSAQGYANAAGASANFPVLTDPFDVLMVNDQKSGVIWGKVGQEIGDVLITERATAPKGYVLPGTVYAQAAYPELFALTGIREVNNDGVNFSTIASPPPFTPTALQCGKDGVFVAVGKDTDGATGGRAYRSVDGVAWSAIPTLNAKNPVVALGTDGEGTWLAPCANGTTIMYRSTDNGLTWVEVVRPGASGYRASAVVSGQPGVWVIRFADPSTGGSWGYVFRSLDNGLTWALVYSNGSDYGSGGLVTDKQGFWLLGGGSARSSPDNFSTVSPFVDYSSPEAGGGVITGTAGSRGTLILSGAGLVQTLASGVYASAAVTDSLGVIHEFGVDQQTGTIKWVTRSYDRGESWARFPVVSRPLSIALRAMSLGGVWVTHYLTAWSRSTRLYNYDAGTQFKTAHAKAPFGLYAYIKAKKA